MSKERIGFSREQLAGLFAYGYELGHDDASAGKLKRPNHSFSVSISDPDEQGGVKCTIVCEARKAEDCPPCVTRYGTNRINFDGERG